MLLSNNGFTPRVSYTRQILKVNNIGPVLGNTVAEDARLAYAQSKGFTGIQLYGLYGVFGNSIKEGQLASFISKAKLTYGLKTVGCIMGMGNAGFISALTYNNSVPAISRFNDFNKENEFWNYFRVDFTVTSAVAGFTYSITLNGVTYSYTANGLDTTVTIATALVTACSPSGLLISNGSPPTNVIKIKDTSSIYSSFTWANSANISDEQIVETYTDWINSLIWLKANIGPNGTISAYVANSQNNWGVTEAEEMCANIDYYEGTNYTKTPNALQNGYRNNQLVYIAQGAFNIGKIQKHYPIFSAEWPAADPPSIPAPTPAPCGEDGPFMGYYLQTNGIPTANSTWLAQYTADAIPNKASLEWTGYNYFVYSCLSLFVP